jgi:hypothetical protein
MEPQKLYLRICVIYIFILLGEVEKKTTLCRVIVQKLRQFLCNTDAICIVPSSR